MPTSTTTATGQIGQFQGLCCTVRSTLADNDPLAVSHAGVGAFRAQRGSETTPQRLVVLMLTRAERGGDVLLLRRRGIQSELILVRLCFVDIIALLFGRGQRFAGVGSSPEEGCESSRWNIRCLERIGVCSWLLAMVVVVVIVIVRTVEVVRVVWRKKRMKRKRET